MQKPYVIIGNGYAAAGCIEGIRSVDAKTPITVISEENHAVYSRPLISYYLENRTDLEHINYRPADFYEKNGCTVLYGKKAVAIDKKKKSVALDDGSELAYTSLLVAAGSVPFVPPFEGLETVENKFTFMKLDDALALEKLLTPDARVLIIGAGMIGLKCAEGIFDRVGEVTVCDLAPRLMSTIIDDECSAPIQAFLEEKGIKFMLEDTAVKFEGNKAVMKSGREIEFDILVTAVGFRPCISLIKEIGGKVNKGIIIGQSSNTSIADIYAAGDCAEQLDISSDTVRVIATVPNAYMQGHCAGVNMAGGDELYDFSMPVNSITFFGMHSMMAGSYYTEEQGGTVYVEKGEGTVKKLYVKDGILTGFIIIGKVENAGIYTALIRNKVKLDSIDFELIKKSPSLGAFDADYRKTKLAREV